MNRIKQIFFSLGILLCMNASAFALELHDQTGRLVKMPARVQRIVALAPSITEIIYALGQEKRLVGVTQYSDYPEAAKNLPRIGSYVRLDLERIVALKPDICFGIREGNPKQQVEKIEALGIPVYIIDPRNLEGIMEAIKGMGAALGASERAESLTREMSLRIARVSRLASATASRPRVFFQVDAAPIITAGTNTFTHELITLAGGRNLGAGPVPYPRLSWEQALALNPEIVVITSMAGGHSPESLKAQWRQWQQLPAVRQNRLYVVEAGLFDRPTPRLVEGLEALAGIIHPELYGGPGGK
ncbi:MAG: ABC transporter substrate-binding protein [Desulfurivibrionaceae bacterium]